MAVYVDNMKAPFGRIIMCHCWADTRDELFAMMDRIGIARKWFQRPDAPGALPGMNASWEHFDIAQSKRALAVQYGAVETDRYGPSEFEARRKFLLALSNDDMMKAAHHLNHWCRIGQIRKMKHGED